MNAMIKSLINNIPPAKVGPWIASKKKKTSYILELLEDWRYWRYDYDFNQYVSPGGRIYCRRNMFYNEKTSLDKIEAVISSFRKTWIQFLQVSHSDATSPIQMGSLIGLVMEMSYSKNCIIIFKKGLVYATYGGRSPELTAQELSRRSMLLSTIKLTDATWRRTMTLCRS